jgi:epoxyqueuosine reductase
MERTVDKRGDATRVVPEARTVIVLGVNYAPPAASADETARPQWAAYALHEDYHDTIKPALVAAGRVLEEWCGVTSADYRYYTDTGPVLERGWAARSGLGFRGKNAMLISRRHGNWLLLATIVTRVAIEPDAPLRPELARASGEEPAGLLCGKCTRCLEACPTAAFPAPGVVDARRCISYQTIENKGAIPRELRAGVGDRIYGCDVCLAVCPWNRFAQLGHSQLLVARRELAELTLRDLLGLDAESFARVFRRTPIKRVKLAGLLRNACVVAGNSGDRALLPLLQSLARHDSPLVRAHAVWAVRRLAGDAAAASWLADARAAESDPAVLAEYE